MLYVFGDSFAKMSDSQPEWVYPTLVAKLLNTEEKNFGYPSSSLEYTFDKFEEQRNNFVEGDVVIITLTLREKTYFFHDRPWLSHLWSFDGIVPYTKEEHDLVKSYFEHNKNEKNSINNLIIIHSIQLII